MTEKILNSSNINKAIWDVVKLETGKKRAQQNDNIDWMLKER